MKLTPCILCAMGVTPIAELRRSMETPETGRVTRPVFCGDCGEAMLPKERDGVYLYMECGQCRVFHR